MLRFRYGFLSLCLPVLLLALLSPSIYAQEIVISETIWNDIQIQYAQLEQQSKLLQSSLTELEAELLTSQTQAALLAKQSENWESLYKQVMITTRQDKVKAYAIGGAIGVVLGAIATAIIASL
jgi:hypothetical protein